MHPRTEYPHRYSKHPRSRLTQPTSRRGTFDPVNAFPSPSSSRGESDPRPSDVRESLVSVLFGSCRSGACLLVAAIAVKVAAVLLLPLETRFFLYVRFLCVSSVWCIFISSRPSLCLGFVRLPAHAAIETFSAAYRAGRYSSRLILGLVNSWCCCFRG